MSIKKGRGLSSRLTCSRIGRRRSVSSPRSMFYLPHIDSIFVCFVFATTTGLSFCGLPWVCGATVQSLNHVRALGETDTMPSGAETIDNITETRVTGFVIHGAILSSLLLLPLLAHIPVPVISGIFLYLGRKMMTGNLFLDRVGQAIVEERQLPMTNAYRLLPRLTVFKYLFIQILMVSAIWFLKQSRSLALFFPSCIGFLVFTRVRCYVC